MKSKINILSEFVVVLYDEIFDYYCHKIQQFFINKFYPIQQSVKRNNKYYRIYVHRCIFLNFNLLDSLTIKVQEEPIQSPLNIHEEKLNSLIQKLKGNRANLISEKIKQMESKNQNKKHFIDISGPILEFIKMESINNQDQTLHNILKYLNFSDFSIE
jgi:hypothetical protein